MAGIYIHIPFCKQACHYCDFHFSTDTSTRTELSQALVLELALRKDYLKEEVDTIYLGGGTPSMLDLRELETLFNAIQKYFSLGANPEISLEANPDDLTREKLKDLRAIGINRLSVGIQSFDDQILKYLNRVHDAGTAYQCVEDARNIGFDNISIDLIYAIPGLSHDLWEETLQQAIRMSPEHISLYALTIETRTVFGHWGKRGKLSPVGEEMAAQQFERIMDALPPSGYEHYEISNFCKPGLYSRHNSNYWKRTPYLGIGPSAHSYNLESRQFNIRNNAQYIRSINACDIPFELEMLTRENRINEYILTTLRTKWGCGLNFLKQELGDDLLQRCGNYLAQLKQSGLVSLEAGTLLLTRKGKLLADQIAEDLMLPV